VDEAVDDDGESGDRNTATGTGELVLLVEDDTGVRAVVRRQLNDLGYLVLEAEDAGEALDMIRSIGEIRYLISDIVMPGQMSGIALAREAKALTPAIRVGLISGYAEDRGMREVVTCPFPVLAKPFATEALAGLMGRSV
jgi:CheY-like chemotaxis protein